MAPTSKKGSTKSKIVESPYTAQFAARVTQLRKEGDAAIEAANNALETPAKKAGNKSYVDIVNAVVLQEFKEGGKNPYKPGMSPQDIIDNQPKGVLRPKTTGKPQFPTQIYETLGVQVGSDGDKLRVGFDGQIKNG